MNRHLALEQPGNPVGVVVDASHPMPEISEAGARHQPDVTGTYHHDSHQLSNLQNTGKTQLLKRIASDGQPEELR